MLATRCHGNWLRKDWDEGEICGTFANFSQRSGTIRGDGVSRMRPRVGTWHVRSVTRGICEGVERDM